MSLKKQSANRTEFESTKEEKKAYRLRKREEFEANKELKEFLYGPNEFPLDEWFDDDKQMVYRRSDT